MFQLPVLAAIEKAADRNVFATIVSRGGLPPADKEDTEESAEKDQGCRTGKLPSPERGNPGSEVIEKML